VGVSGRSVFVFLASVGVKSGLGGLLAGVERDGPASDPEWVSVGVRGVLSNSMCNSTCCCALDDSLEVDSTALFDESGRSWDEASLSKSLPKSSTRGFQVRVETVIGRVTSFLKALCAIPGGGRDRSVAAHVSSFAG
jgi:hypothetical protein